MRRIFNRPERIVPLLSLFLLPLLAAPAAGGVLAGNGEVGFDLGWVDLDGRGDGRGDGDGGRLSIRGGYHFTDRFQLEGQLLGIGIDGPRDLEALGGVFVNAVFNFHPGENVVPYVLVGVGAVDWEPFPYYHCHGDHWRDCHWDHGGRYHEDEASGAVQVGVGSRFFLGQGRTAFRLEASLLAFEDDFDRGRELLSLSAGLTWRLGRHRPPAVTAAGAKN